MTHDRITVVVPSFREAENLPHLIDRVAGVREAAGLDLDILLVDDDSQDGSEALVESRPEKWVRLIVRKRTRGLSTAVLDGFRQAQGDVLVWDADLSHPPVALPQMSLLDEGADFASDPGMCREGRPQTTGACFAG